MDSSHFVLCENPLAFIKSARERFSEISSDICDISQMNYREIRQTLTNAANALKDDVRILYICGLETVNEKDLDCGMLHFLDALGTDYFSTCKVENPRGLTVAMVITKERIGYANSTKYLCIQESDFEKFIPMFCVASIHHNE